MFGSFKRMQVRRRTAAPGTPLADTSLTWVHHQAEDPAMRSERLYDCLCGIALATVLLTWAGPAGAADSAGSTERNSSSIQVAPGSPSPQTSSDAPHDVPNPGLTDAQRQTIYQSIHNGNAHKNAEPVGFRAAVGAHVPDSIAIEPLPRTVVELVPSLHGYGFAFVANQVLIVQPQSKTVVDVITQ
jgi:hypothetical protein